MAKIKKGVGAALADKENSMTKSLDGVVEQLLTNVKSELLSLSADLKAEVQSSADELLAILQNLNFPDNSIPAKSIDFSGIKFSSDRIVGGSIKKFNSTGIEDLANKTKLTVMDNMVVIENKLVAQQLEIKGNVVIDGNVTIHGDMPLDNAIINKIVAKMADRVHKQLHSEIKTKLENISGDNIVGGIITNFSSNGIEDRAEETQLTVLDNIVVIESNLVTQSLSVKGDTVIEGNLTILGDMPLDKVTRSNLVREIATQVHEQVSNEIKTEIVGSLIKEIKDTQFDVKNILIKGRPLIIGDSELAPFIKETRIRTVGTIKQLEVTGEAQLCGSFYAGNKRVGINTTEPAAALSVWDEEIEIVLGKHSSNRSYIGTLRQQEVVLGAHNKQNIILSINGVTAIKTLVADRTKFSSSDKAPNHQSEMGSVCFNTKPDIGLPYGWICLGGARWGIMGLIE